MGTLTDADLVNQTSLTAHYAATLKSDPGGVISRCQMTTRSDCTAATLFWLFGSVPPPGHDGVNAPSNRPRVRVMLDVSSTLSPVTKNKTKNSLIVLHAVFKGHLVIFGLIYGPIVGKSLIYCSLINMFKCSPINVILSHT